MRVGALISAGTLMLQACLAAAGENVVKEYTMKAAYVYNFAQLAEWPSSVGNDKASPFSVCVSGTDDWGGSMELLQGKTIDGRALDVRRVATSDEVRQCQVLFIAEGDGRRGERLIDGARGQPILTVTDDGRIRDAMLTISSEKQRLVFEVNLEMVRGAQLRLSSKLLRLATRVVGQ